MTTQAPAEPAQPDNNIHAALAAFQAELPRVGKDNTAKVNSERGQGYTYRYADLSDISPEVLPLLAKHGMAWTTRPTLTHDGKFVLRYALTHTSGEVIDGDWPLPNPASSSQVLGSAVTYARRYALCAVTGVAPGGDDDDAAAASQRQERAQPPRRPSNTGPPANGAETATQAAERANGRPAEAATPSRQVGAALALLRQTCESNGWSMSRVAQLYAETHGGADIRSASAMRDVEEFRKGLFSRPDHELKELAAEEAASG